MASAVARAYNGVWGQSPQQGSGAEPLVRGSGGQSLHEAEALLAFGRSMEAANLAAFLKFGKAKTLKKFVLSLPKKSWVATKPGAGAKLGACAPPPGPGLKPPLTLALSLTVIEIWSVFR